MNLEILFYCFQGIELRKTSFISHEDPLSNDTSSYKFAFSYRQVFFSEFYRSVPHWQRLCILLLEPSIY